MGTRGLLGVIVDGKTYAFYNSCDSYPSRLGFNFLHSVKQLLQDGNKSKLKAKLNSIQWDESYEDLHEIMQDQPSDEWRENDQLRYLLNCSDDLKLRNDADFFNNALFCEWAYYFDLDVDDFIVYKSCADDPNIAYPTYNMTQYLSVKLTDNIGSMIMSDIFILR